MQVPESIQCAGYVSMFELVVYLVLQSRTVSISWDIVSWGRRALTLAFPLWCLAVHAGVLATAVTLRLVWVTQHVSMLVSAGTVDSACTRTRAARALSLSLSHVRVAPCAHNQPHDRTLRAPL